VNDDVSESANGAGMMQCQNQSSLGGFGLMDKLNNSSLAFESPLLSTFSI
jgi:hypothetical protein